MSKAPATHPHGSVETVLVELVELALSDEEHACASKPCFTFCTNVCTERICHTSGPLHVGIKPLAPLEEPARSALALIRSAILLLLLFPCGGTTCEVAGEEPGPDPEGADDTDCAVVIEGGAWRGL